MDKNCFPLARINDLLQKYVSNRREKICHYQEYLKIRLKNSFNYPENLFPLTGISQVSEKKEKKWFRQARKSVTSSKKKVAFQKLDFQVSISTKKNLRIK